jgi:transposase-like protein
LSHRRNTKAAKHVLKKFLKGNKDYQPQKINTDKNPAYGVAIAELKTDKKLKPDIVHRQVKYLNNRIEADHRKLKMLIKLMRGFQSMKTAYATIKGFEVIGVCQSSCPFHGSNVMNHSPLPRSWSK